MTNTLSPSHQKNISFTFHDAGHIFGSAFVEIIAEGKKIVFSGDIGNVDMPIVRDTSNLPTDVDLLVCESTYGGHIHEANTFKHREEIIKNIITKALSLKGALMIPSFALERTQELLYILNDLIDRQHLLPKVPIFLDSPLAISATKVYRQYPRYYDSQATEWFKEDQDLFSFPGLNWCVSKEESKKINHVPNPKIIIAGAGMMNGGRILHHALRHVTEKESTLLFVGYQAQGTLGRKILNGESQVNILGEHIPVKCNIKAIGALSAHADQKRLLTWISSSSDKKIPKKIYLNHGEPKEAEALATLLKNNLGAEVEMAKIGMDFVVL
jgi:metallo-beta-lactamase family protein